MVRPLVAVKGASGLPWTAHLEVFEQDFDTAMTIWSVEDAAVGRLCADEAPMTRRRRNVTNSQVELSQLSELSQASSTQSRGKKRRRVQTANEGRRDIEAPPAPLPGDLPTQTQEIVVTQSLSFDGVGASSNYSDTQESSREEDGDITKILSALERTNAKSLSPIPEKCVSTTEAFGVPYTSSAGPTSPDTARSTSPDTAAAVVTTEERSRLPLVASQDERVPSAFSTGSGRSLLVSRKRVRDYEMSFVSDLDVSSERPFPAEDDGITTFAPNTSDRAPVIDPRRLSFSSVVSECTEVSSNGFMTGSGRKIQLASGALAKYESFLFADENSSSLKNSFRVDSDSIPRTKGTRHHDKSEREGLPTNPQNSDRWTMTSFQTGAGKSVSVPEERISQYAQELFVPADRNDGAEASVSALDRSKCSPISTIESATSGFQTASGRTVVIPEDRLKAIASRLFAEDHLVDNTSSDQEEEHDSVGGTTESSERVQCDHVTPSPHVSSSFQTGSGLRVHVSQDKLLRYTREFQDGRVTTLSQSAAKESAIGAFATGRGAQISISQKYLNKYEKLLAEDISQSTQCAGELDPDTSQAESNSVSAGFFTGSGKQIPISKEKLFEYEQKILREDGSSDRVPEHEPGVGFSSASGRTIPISREKLREYQMKFAQDLQNSIGNSETLPIHVESPVFDGVVLKGFTTGNGHSVAVPEDKLREYQSRLFEPLDDFGRNVSEIGSSLKTSTGSRSDQLIASPQDSASLLSNRPRSRRSTGSAASTRDVPTTNRRHSLPPRHELKATDQRATPGVSSGVIRRMSMANQKQSRPVLDDLSNTFVESRPCNGLMTAGKGAQGLDNNSYSTPAKSRLPKPSNLSAKKGFRPPLPSKTPPSKTIVTPTRNIVPQATPAKAEKTKSQSISVMMPFVEAMRISYSMLIAERNEDSHSYLSDPRVKILCQIDPQNAPAVAFSANGEHLLNVTDTLGSDAVTFEHMYSEMKQRGWIGEDSAVSTDWFRNHYRWIVWKLATLELRSPRYLLGRYLTKSQVMYQLCKRYERDVVLAQRSVLKKILNRDANAASCMVLRVAAVVPYPVEEETDIDIVPPPHWKLSIVLTDGWYGVYAMPDPDLAEMMWKHHKENKLIGMKIATWSATLQNVSDGVDPMECALACDQRWTNPLLAGKDDPSKWPYLRLHINSTRPVHGDTRLGLESLTRTTTSDRRSDASYDFVLLKSIPMRSLQVGGGVVRSVRIRVTRVSPILHLQSKDFSIGPRILCEEQMPQYLQARQEYLQRVKSETDREDDSTSSPAVPLPVPFLKLEVECAHTKATKSRCFAVVTVWRPSEDLLLKLKDGGTYFATSLSINWKVDYGVQGVFMRVGTTKGSSFEEILPSDVTKNPFRKCTAIQDLIVGYQRHVEEKPKEKKMLADVCVVIIRYEESKAPCDQRPEATMISSTDHVFATDRSGRLISIRVTSTRVFKPTIANSDQVPLMPMKQHRVFTRGNRKLWSEGNVVCISGLEVSHFDEKLGVLDCDLVESAQIVSLPSKRSHFYEDAKTLRGLLAGEGNESQELLRRLKKLRIHLERKVLLLDGIHSQDDEEGSAYDDVDEVNHLTQDLHSQAEGDPDMWLSQIPLVCVEGVVVKVIPVDENESRTSAHEVVAIAYVRDMSKPDEEGCIHAFYLSRPILDSTRKFLDSPLDGSQLLRIEGQWETSERLLNSWKPWERDASATFLVASSISEARPRKTT